MDLEGANNKNLCQPIKAMVTRSSRLLAFCSNRALFIELKATRNRFLSYQCLKSYNRWKLLDFETEPDKYYLDRLAWMTAN